MRKAKYILALKNSSSDKDSFTIGQIYEYEDSDLLHIMPTIIYKFYGDDNIIVYLGQEHFDRQFEPM